MVVTLVAIMGDIMETTEEVLMVATLEALVGVIMELIMEVMVETTVGTLVALVVALEVLSMVEVPTVEDQSVEPQGMETMGDIMEGHQVAMEAAVGATSQDNLAPVPTPEATPRVKLNLESRKNFFNHLIFLKCNTYCV